MLGSVSIAEKRRSIESMDDVCDPTKRVIQSSDKLRNSIGGTVVRTEQQLNGSIAMTLEGGVLGRVGHLWSATIVRTDPGGEYCTPLKWLVQSCGGLSACSRLTNG
jgi:hypothetical protein